MLQLRYSRVGRGSLGRTEKTEKSNLRILIYI